MTIFYVRYLILKQLLKLKTYLMKTFITFISLCTIICVNAIAQPVAVSPHTSDQVELGPCYIFATIAALESNAMKHGGTSVNFNEWQFYSTCVMGSFSGSPDIMIPKTVDHFANYGAYSGNHFNPTANSCPNPDDPLVKCIADFTCSQNNNWCKNNQMYLVTPEATCEDDDKTNVFTFEPNGGVKYDLSSASDGTYFKKINLRNSSTTVKSNQIKDLINSGTGVIANFSQWPGGDGHSIFIHGYTNSIWKYKDSWPSNAGPNQMTSLNLQYLTEIYYISGKVTATVSCNEQISGNSTIYQDTYYNLYGGNASNITWSVSNNLTIVSGQGTTSLKVRPNTCSNTTGTINASYNNSSCNVSKNISIKGASPTPNSIFVLSPNWGYSGQTCPNTSLELNANVNPISNDLYYDWSIAGATLNSGQGTATVFVTTPSSNSYLTFRVRTRRGSCPYSSWRTIYGYSSSSNSGCFGSGGYKVNSTINSELDFVNFFKENPSVNKANVSIYSINGQQLYNGTLDKFNAYLSITNLQIPSGVIIIHLFDEISSVSQSYKHLVKSD